MLRITVSHSESAWIFVAVFESCVVCAEVCACLAAVRRGSLWNLKYSQSCTECMNIF